MRIKYYLYKTQFQIFLIFLLKVTSTHGVIDPDHHFNQLPVPVSKDHVTWNARVLRAIPPVETWFDLDEKNDALSDVSEECQDSLKFYKDELFQMKLWALTMFDSSTKIPEGVASGAFTHLGNFDQCLSVKSNDGKNDFKGQYCGTGITLTSGLSQQSKAFGLYLKIASCIPSTCSNQDLKNFLESKLSLPLLLIGVKTEIDVQPDSCYIEGDKPPLDDASWGIISLFLIIASYVILLTIVVDVIKFKTNSEKVNSALESFSLFRNFSALMKTEHARGAITCLHGIRVGSLLWVILGHRYGNQTALPMINTNDVFEMYSKVETQIVLNGKLAVDSFFLLSGFLVCYLLMKDLTKGNKFNPIMYYVHRYVRLTTCYAIVIAFYATVGAYIGYGPNWKENTNFSTQLCKDTWWTGLLYVDNYVVFEQYAENGIISSCLTQGWYLSVDMQLSWLAPLVLLPLYYWPKWTTIIILPVLILASCFAPFTAAYTVTHLSISEKQKYNLAVYIAAYMRATPYLMGICLAYFIYKKPQDIRMPKWLALCGWVLSTAVTISVFSYTYMMYQPDFYFNQEGYAFYSGFHRLAWSCVLIWIIIACHYGYGGPANKILSWRGWLPLSRLSYCMFLTHVYIQTLERGNAKTLIYFNHFSTIQNFCADLIFSALVSVVLHLFIEAPTLGLLKTFLRRPASSK